MSTNNQTFRVVITKDEDGTFIADIPSLNHCTSYGDTLELAMANIKEALAGTIEVMLEEGIPVPDDSNQIEYSLSYPVKSNLEMV
jgi:antitoxin HicB